MKRPLRFALICAVAASLTATGLAAPTAQAGRVDPQNTRYRYFQDLSMSGQFQGRILFGALYAKNRAGQFTPRELVSLHLETGVSCNPGGDIPFAIGGNAASKYGYFAASLTNGRFAHIFGSELSEAQAPTIQGGISGTVLKRVKRDGRVTRTARIDGSFLVADWDPFGMTGVQENCTSAGTYSAVPCKRRMGSRAPNFNRWKRWKVPICYQDPW
jgi:hypothetical protein